MQGSQHGSRPVRIPFSRKQGSFCLVLKTKLLPTLCCSIKHDELHAHSQDAPSSTSHHFQGLLLNAFHPVLGEIYLSLSSLLLFFLKPDSSTELSASLSVQTAESAPTPPEIQQILKMGIHLSIFLFYFRNPSSSSTPFPGESQSKTHTRHGTQQ